MAASFVWAACKCSICKVGARIPSATVPIVAPITSAGVEYLLWMDECPQETEDGGLAWQCRPQIAGFLLQSLENRINTKVQLDLHFKSDMGKMSFKIAAPF